MESQWVTPARTTPSPRVRLFCFPYAGGGAAMFHQWARLLPGGVQLCPVQLPGREARRKEPLFTHLSPLVQELARVLPSHFDRPFAFFGHSMGAIISFELTRQLRRQGSPMPVRLFLSGRRAPDLPLPQAIYHLPEDEFLSYMRDLKGTPEEVLSDPDLKQLFLPILRADFRILDTYSYTPELALDCPMSVYGGIDDDVATRDQLEQWRLHTTAETTVQMFQGGHFFLRTARDEFLQALGRDLDRLLGDLNLKGPVPLSDRRAPAP